MKDQEALGELKQFLATHFHEDWMEGTARAETVIDRFLATKPDAAQLSELARGIELFVNKHSTQIELEAAFYSELWCHYMPSADGKTIRDWLESLKVTFLNEAKRLGA